MARQTVKIWFINRSVDLVSGKLGELRNMFTHLSDGEVRKRFRPTFCTRSNPDGESKYQLMPKVEYFVPFPIKCIGDRYQDTAGLDESGKEILNGILAHYHDLYESDELFYSWWDKANNYDIFDIENGRYMATPRGVGYYDLIEEADFNILVGYSQGGTVARYLAFLDRYVFKENKVSAVITINSPNQGAPFANPMNQEHVTGTLLEFVVSLLSVNTNVFPSLAAALPDAINFEQLYKLVTAGYEDARSTGNTEWAEFLGTAIKWFSGLYGDPKSAFKDLSTTNYLPDNRFSVLSLINSPEYSLSSQGVWLANIISANDSVDEILGSLIGSPIKKIAYSRVKAGKLFGHKIGNNLKTARNIYSQKAILDDDYDDEDPDFWPKELRSRYIHGAKVLKSKPKNKRIQPFRHDFLIPSVYQMLPDHESSRIIAQIVNEEASHNSGASLKHKPGEQNYTHLFNLMRYIRNKW